MLHYTEEPDDHDDVEYLGTTNGTKDVSEKPETSDEKTDDAGDGDKATTEDTATKEPLPDFTVTPSKDGGMILTFCLSHDLTYHLAPAPFVLLLRLSGTVSHLMSAHVPLSQHSVNI